MPLSPYSWVVWNYVWQPPATGRHTIVVRAMDKRGVRQDAEPGRAFPDGASGLHEVTVKVAV